MSVYSNKAHNKWDEPASSALALCLLASSSGLGFDRSAPPLARIRRLHLMLYAHASFRQRYSDMSCQSPKQCNFQDFFRPSSGTFPLVKGSIPGRREREGGLPSDPLPPSDFFLWSEPICFTLDRSTSLARLHVCLFALSAVLLACLNWLNQELA